MLRFGHVALDDAAAQSRDLCRLLSHGAADTIGMTLIYAGFSPRVETLLLQARVRRRRLSGGSSDQVRGSSWVVSINRLSARAAARRGAIA